MIAICLLVLIGGGAATIMAARERPNRSAVAHAYADAWSRGDYEAMNRLLSGAARRWAANKDALAEIYTAAARTATLTELKIDEPSHLDDDLWEFPVVATTRAFGTVAGRIRIAIVDENGQAHVDLKPFHVFPGLRSGERLTRETQMPERGSLLARDGTAIAQGPGRQPAAAGAAASNVIGSLGAIPASERATAERAGYPADAKVGISGLERIFERQLAGSVGGRLLAGRRTIASRAPQRGENVRTSLSLRVQTAATEALAGRAGAIAAIAPTTGEILGVAGNAWSGLQPPGSTFKIITAAAALEQRLASPQSQYPVATSATLSGVQLNNSFEQPCGGTLAQSFAKSCNSVFAPLGAKVGAKRLIAVASRFGFDRPPPFPGAAISTVGDPELMTDDLAVGSAAIGQGKTQATALQMAVVAATIGLKGRRPEVTLAYRNGRKAPTTAAIGARVAGQVGQMMVAAVQAGGTGAAAAIPGVTVAGKTGTAELRTVNADCVPDPNLPASCPADGDPANTTAWFTAYAPAGPRTPRVAVSVMLAGAGHGGDTAAPAAKTVLTAALKATG